VAASTQNQALSALLFLYKEVLKQEIGWLKGVERAKRPMRLPVVLTRDEVHKMLANLHGIHRLMAGLLYGSGLRLMECVRLCVKDIDLGYLRITVRDGKGAKHRVTMLPANLAKSLERHLQKIKIQQAGPRRKEPAGLRNSQTREAPFAAPGPPAYRRAGSARSGIFTMICISPSNRMAWSVDSKPVCRPTIRRARL
jgi:integrase